MKQLFIITVKANRSHSRYAKYVSLGSAIIECYCYNVIRNGKKKQNDIISLILE